MAGRPARLPDLRFHDLRGTHATLLLDPGAPVNIVAERIGDNPAALLRTYEKRKNTADNSVSTVIGAPAAGFLKAWRAVGSKLAPVAKLFLIFVPLSD
jgi:hypothetical protein